MKRLLLSFLLLIPTAALAQFAGPGLQVRMQDTNQALTAGMWRFRLTAGEWRLEKNTAAAGTFTTLTTPFRATTSGIFVPGFSLAVTNPDIGNDPNERRAFDMTVTTDSTTSTNGFSNEGAFRVTLNAIHGQGLYGGGTNAKRTFLPFALVGNYAGSGQHFAQSSQVNCWGMGDCFLHSNSVTFATADIAGDEGQGFQSVSYVSQQPNLNKATINSTVVRSSCNTTLTQNVTASQTAQSVTVASAAGCLVDDWVVVGQAVMTGIPNIEALKITASSTGHISGVFTTNQLSGTTITPAVVFTVDNPYQWGQDRVLVNLSASTYTTGTVSSISGGGFVGSGTSWSNTMVSGSATNIGCITLTADDYTGTPFGSGANALKSWYQITSVPNTTHLGIFTFSVAADAAYRGLGPGTGGYIIAPCARVLRLVGSTVITESSAATWSNGNSVELAIAPYPDVSGSYSVVRTYTPGGTYRGFQSVDNRGSRTWDVGFSVTAAMLSTGGGDTWGWTRGFYVDGAKVGHMSGPNIKDAAIQLSPVDSKTGRIRWGNADNSPNIHVIDSDAMVLCGIDCTYGRGSPGALTINQSTYPRAWARFVGKLALESIASNNEGTALRFDRVGDNTSDHDPDTATEYTDIAFPTIATNLFGHSYRSLVFHSYSSGSGYDINVFALDDAGTVGNPALGAAASNTTNKNSGTYRWQSSVWTGSAAARRWFESYTSVASGVNNAAITWNLRAITSATTYNEGYPDTVASVSDAGKLSFGLSNPAYGGYTSKLATLDPTNLTADRTLTVPNFSGTVLLDSTAGSVFHLESVSGADLAAKVATCIALLPSTGGTCDGTGIAGAQAWGTTVTVGKSIDLVLGCYTTTASVTMFNMTAGTLRVRGHGRGCTIIGAGSGFPDASLIVINGSAFSSVEHMRIDMNAAPTKNAIELTGVAYFPVLQDLNIAYPSATGTGSAMLLTSVSSLQVHDIFVQSAGYCIDMPAAGANVFLSHDIHQLNCENPIIGLRMLRTLAPDIGGMTVEDSQFTNPGSRSNNQGIVLSSSVADTAGILNLVNVIVDGSLGGPSVSITNWEGVSITGSSWITNTASSGSNYSALKLNGVQQVNVVGMSVLYSASRSIELFGTTHDIVIVGNLFSTFSGGVDVYIDSAATLSKITIAGNTAGAPALTNDLTRFAAAAAVSVPVLTVSNLPTCNSAREGVHLPLTDANTATWGATITTTGANHVDAYCNGSAWTVAAK